MNITLITAEEQKHYEDCIEIQIETESDADVKTSTGTGAIFCDTFLPKTTISITEKLGIAMQSRIHNAEQKEPAMYILVLLDAFQEKKFWDEEECFARLNKENMEAVRYVLYEYSKAKKSYILSEYSSR